MRKLKTFSLSQGHQLSCEEMAMLEGGDFISFYCYTEGASCAIEESGGIYTGTCQYVTVNAQRTIACVKN